MTEGSNKTSAPPNITTDNFFKGGGEMGQLIREYDWSKTQLGAPEEWPLSLRTLVAMILSSRFPMLILWGPDLIQFYNDSFRPSLGIDGKHPLALGQKGKDAWAEIWDVIHPLFQQALNGESVWNEDQLVPFYRNGRMEDIYWTFSYSPVKGDSGKIEGILVVCTETTKQVKSLQQLSLSEQRFQNLIREANVGIIVLSGEEMRVSIVNEHYGKLVERTTEELLNKPLFDTIPNSEKDFRPILDKVRLTGEPLYLYEHPYFIHANGEKKPGYLNLVYQPYKEADGTITGVMVLCQDVTTQQAAKKGIKESEQKIRSFIDSAPFPIGVYVGREMRIQYANQSILDVWGKGNDVIGKLYSHILPELENQEVFKQLDQVYTTGKPFHAKYQRLELMIGGKLEEFYFNYSFTPLYNNEGNVYGVMNTAADVTDLAIATKKIEESEQRFRNMAEGSEILIAISDETSNATYFNKAWSDLTGRPVKDLLSFGWADLLHAEDRKGFLDTYLTAFKNREAWTGEFRILSKEGDYRWLLAKGPPHYGPNGSFAGYISSSIDITERKQAEKELKLKNEELLRVNNDLDNFIYTASHDLRAPVSNIEGLLSAHAADSDFSVEQQAVIDMMFRSIERFKTTIHDLTEISKIQRVDQTDLQTLNFATILNEVKLDIRELIERFNPAITTNFEVEELNFSRKNLRSIIFNLLSNALKYSSPNRKPEVKISTEKNNDFTILKVSDNGLGLSLENQSKIFGMFKRAHQHIEGSGIGLYMIKRMIENSGGKIEIQSEVDRGTTFSVYLKNK